MKRSNKINSIVTLIAVQLFTAMLSFGQSSNFKIKDGNMIISIPKTWTQANCDSTMNTLNLVTVNMDSLVQMNLLGNLGKEGWKILSNSKSKNTIELYKPVSEIEGRFIKSMNTDLLKKAQESTTANVQFGRNKTSFSSIKEDKDGFTIFELKGYIEANKVVISGSFNQWSVMQNPMLKTSSGWQIKLPLPYGKITYKFIVDGKWMHDPQNPQIEPNGTNGFNSVYFRTNHTFLLQGFESAKAVTLAGSFNNWNPTEISMIKKENGWQLPVYLEEGTHTYKFIVDGKWILDPHNENSRPDGFGNTNSVINLGHKIKFALHAYPNARSVTVCGTFNNWNPEEIILKKTSDYWTTNYIVPKGNHEYKFVVDGKWIMDPHNPCSIGSGEQKNSVLSVEPNHCFSLSGFKKAYKVIVTGTFNDWNPSGYTMQRNGEKWELNLYLPPGKHLYKFIVDDQWMIDPGNPHWEQNEHNTGNSILWMESRITMNK